MSYGSPPGGYGPPPQGYGPPGYPQQPQQPYGYGPPPQQNPFPGGPQGGQPRTNPLAITSLVTGIIALLCGAGSWVCCFLVFLAAPLAFILSAVSIPTGAIAMSQNKRAGGALGGTGMAVAGLVCGIVALIPTILWVILIGFSAATSP
jgi:hypothetical protein